MGSPRSGTTALYEILVRSPAATSLAAESHLLWETFHPGPPATSHAVDAAAVTDRERRMLYWAIRSLGDELRYVDKNPRNSLRLSYLRALFPDAWFVFLKRDGRAVLSSLMSGWRSSDPRFPSIDVGQAVSLEAGPERGWRFLVPPGWETYVRGRTLAEVCAFQWIAANEAILAGRAADGGARWVDVKYEDLIEGPEDVVRHLLTTLGLPLDARTLEHARTLHRRPSRTTVTAPQPEKWRIEHEDEVQRVVALIRPTMIRLGYDVEENPAGVPRGPEHGERS